MEEDRMKGTYSIYITGYDWSACSNKVLVHLEEKISEIKASELKVVETKNSTDFIPPKFPITVKDFDRTVLDAYLCDENGQVVSEPSDYFMIVLDVSPNEGSVFCFSMITQFNTWCDPYYLTITDVNGTLEIDTTCHIKETNADRFALEEYTAKDGIKYSYVHYEPEKPSDVLVVWLHGLGEGGTEKTDARISVLANRVTALIEHKFQRIVGKVNVVAPQCPTYWMDNDGTGRNLFGGKIDANEHSHYQESLYEFIMAHKQRVGAKKVVVCGCSNGGYMTMIMAINYPKDWACCVPICEALDDACITDQDIEKIKDLPIYFVYSKDDPVVVPSKYEEPTIERLKAVNAKVHVSVTDHVYDLTRKVKTPNGLPHQYMGHWSWIYFDNNETKDENGLSAFEFIKQNI